MIKDLPMNVCGRLSVDSKKQLILIIEQEFSNKQSLYHQIIVKEKEKILDAYRKSIGFDKLRADYDKAEKSELRAKDMKENCKEKISEQGLTIEGTVDSATYYDADSHSYKENYAVKELKKKLKAVEDNSPSVNMKNKLISRMTLSTTIGEANEIMREILGNGIIPATDIKSITFQE